MEAEAREVYNIIFHRGYMLGLEHAQAEIAALGLNAEEAHHAA